MAKVKICRHVTSLSLPKLLDRLKDENLELEVPVASSDLHPVIWICTFCLDCFSLKSNGLVHARRHNHQIFYLYKVKHLPSLKLEPLKFEDVNKDTVVSNEEDQDGDGGAELDKLEGNHFFCCLCLREIDSNELPQRQSGFLRDAQGLFEEILTIAEEVNRRKNAAQARRHENINLAPSTKVDSDEDSNNKVEGNDQKDKENSERGESLSLRPCGLVNLGNTCFMNSTLQALSASLVASRRFTDDVEDEFGSIGQALCSTLKSLIICPSTPEPAAKKKGGKKHSRNHSNESGGGPVLDSGPFLGAFAKKYREFGKFRQQDSHDFLRLLFNALDEEHAALLKQTGQAKSNGDEEQTLAFHQKCFGGRFVSRVICKVCGEKTDMKEPFMDLSLPLSLQPDSENDDFLPNIGSLSLANRVDHDEHDAELGLVDLIRFWAKPAHLVNENAFACEACARKCRPEDWPNGSQPPFVYQPATQQFLLSGPLPPILIFHLQRFALMGFGRRSVRLAKDHRGIQLPEYLDLASFCHESCDTPTQYRLTAMVIHEGASVDSGHYVAVVRYGDDWWYTSDSRVRPASPLSVYNPYLVIYNRID